MTTPQYIDVPAEACPHTRAASQSVRGWLRSELMRKLEPTRPGKRTNRPFVEHVGILPLPSREKPQKPTCTVPLPDGSLCGRKGHARGMCMTHYERSRTNRPMNPESSRPGRRRDVTNEMLRALLQSGMSQRAIARKLGMAYGSIRDRLNRDRLSPIGVGLTLPDWSVSGNVSMDLESTYSADPRVTPDLIRSSGGALITAAPEAHKGSR